MNEHGVGVVFVDYVQLLQAPGKSRYEQTTNASIAIRQLATRHNVAIIALAQLNRQIEMRTKYVPNLSDLRDTGQFEQDADVIIFDVWPHKIDSSQPKNYYQFFVGKNRNRAINAVAVSAHIDPARQSITDSTVRDMPNYEPAFEDNYIEPYWDK